MKTLALAAFAIVGISSFGNAATIDPPVIDTLGDCRASDGVVDMHTFMFVENTSLVTSSSQGAPRRLVLENERVLIEPLDGPDKGRVFFHDVAYLVSPLRSIDIDLKFVSLDQTIGVYWRETYKHQRYRQGIFRVEGTRLERWCAGYGGANSYH